MELDNATLTTLDSALCADHVLYSFRSGGGLCVVRIERGAKYGGLAGYGEHPDLSGAIAMAAKDYTEGQQIYRTKRPDPHYLTGSYDVGSPLEAWIKRGNNVLLSHKKMFKAVLAGYAADCEEVEAKVAAPTVKELFEQASAKALKYNLRT